MSHTEQKLALDMARECLEYIDYILDDYPDKLTKFPEDKHISDIVSVKKVVSKTLSKCFERVA